jgi:hypothetical protein
MSIHRSEFSILYTMIFGCGGRGTMAVHHCRELLLKELFENDEGKLKDFSPIRFFAVDSAEQTLQDTGEHHNLDTIEVAFHDIGRIIADTQFPTTGRSVKAVGSLFPPNRDYAGMLRNLRDSTLGMNTCPPLGRMNFLGSWERIYSQLREKINNTWKNPFPSSGLPVKPIEEWNQVFIVAGIYGGAGSGVHIDLAAMLRFIFDDLEIPQPAIYGIFFLPDIVGKKVELLRANAYACLKELDYFLSGNPYTVTLADNTTLSISNTRGNDCLFNKVFLINDRNKHRGIPGIQLTEGEVAEMVGEVLFQWSCTTLGERINNNIQDAPNVYTLKWAPYGESGVRERRITAYSTFGLATAYIPYEQLKRNLIVNFAIEVMNDILLIPDDETMEEKREIERKRELFFRDFFRPSQVFSRLGLTEEALTFNISPPPFVGVETLEDFMEENDLGSVKEVHSRIRGQIRPFIEKAGAGSSYEAGRRFEDKFLNSFREELTRLKDEMLNRGGPQLAAQGLLKLKEHILGLISEVRGGPSSPLEHLRQRLRDLLQRGDRKIDETRDRPFWRKFWGDRKELREFEREVFSPLKKGVRDYCRAMLSETAEVVLKRCLRVAEEIRSDLIHESRRFEEILEKLRNHMLPYRTGTFRFTPIPNDVLNDFIDDFPYPTGSRPEDVADSIRNEGLDIDLSSGRVKIQVHEFDDHPAEVAEAILKRSEEVIERISSRCWNKTFSESGMFPLGGLHSATRWHLHAYENTMDELIKRSSPYLEYQDNDGFETYKETFIVFPSASLQELKKWESTPVPGNKEFRFVGDAECSPYHITMLQLHYGLPLYSIDEIEDWLENYRSVLASESRPLHKFKFRLREPYINTTEMKKSYPREQVEELYQWAKRVSEQGRFSILIHVPGHEVWIVDSDEEAVEEFYFRIYEEVFLSLEEIERLLEEHAPLREDIKSLVKNVINRLAGSSLSRTIDDFATGSDEEKDKLMLDVLRELSKKELPSDCDIKVNREGKIHIVPEACPDGYHLLKAIFYRKKARRELKDGITDEKIIEELSNNPEFFTAFLKRCEEAISHMKRTNRLLTPPDAFRELVSD